MSTINIGVKVLFVLAFPLSIALIYVLKPFIIAIGLISNHFIVVSRLARLQRDFSDCLKLGRVLYLLKIWVLAEVVRETVICLRMEAGMLAIDALLSCLCLFFCQFIAYRQKILRDLPSDLIRRKSSRILWNFELRICLWWGFAAIRL